VNTRYWGHHEEGHKNAENTYPRGIASLRTGRGQYKSVDDFGVSVPESQLSFELQDMSLEQETDSTYPDKAPKRCDAHVGPNDLMWGDFKETRRHSTGLVVTD